MEPTELEKDNPIIIHVGVNRDGVTYVLSPASRLQIPGGRPRVFLGHVAKPANREYDAHCWPAVTEILTGMRWSDIGAEVFIVDPVTKKTLHKVG